MRNGVSWDDTQCGSYKSYVAFDILRCDAVNPGK
jgi:hypothetical protein